jgi:hypothetical protein
LLTSFLVLRYISAIHIPLPRQVAALVTVNNSDCTCNHFRLFNLELTEEPQIGNKIVKPQANTWIADQALASKKYMKVSVELNSMVLFLLR